MAETAMLRLEEMLPEATYFIEKEVFTRAEMKKIMDERRMLELGVNSRTSSLKDFMSYINHEIKVECDRRERYDKMKILRATHRDFTIVKRIHTLFDRCVSKYSADVSVWHKYIEFCSTSGGSSALSKVIMRAIKRHPRVASFRVIAADRELQQGGLIAARKLLMRAIRIKTDDQLMIWQQLFKLECAAIHRMITIGNTQAKSTESAAASEELQETVPTCQAATVVLKHALRDLAQIGRADAFRTFATEAVDAMEMALLGFPSPRDMDELKDSLRE